VIPQLIGVSDDAHLWTDRYTADLEPGQIFSVQAEIAEQVAAALDVTILEPERQRLAARSTENMEAYDYYLRGNDYYYRGAQEDGLAIAVEMYEKAIELDPGFALGYARLSIVHAFVWWLFYDRSQERLAMAREAVNQALSIDPDLREAHEALGWYHYWGQQDYEPVMPPRAATAPLAERFDTPGSPADTTVFVAAVIDVPPNLLGCPPIQYPAMMQQSRIEGSVVLQFVVERDGSVRRETIETIRSTHELFEASAKAMVAQCFYRPGRLRGNPVRVLVQTPVNFTLEGG